MFITGYLCYLFAFPKEDGYHEVDIGFDLEDYGMIDKDSIEFDRERKNSGPTVVGGSSSGLQKKISEGKNTPYEGKSADLI